MKCSFKKRKKLKTHWRGPTGTPPGTLRKNCGMLLFSLFKGSERCKCEKMARRQCLEDNSVQMLDECNLSDPEDVFERI
jgi:hypothetical protein